MSTTVDMAFFGKLPSRGDFVRTARHAGLVKQLDDWLSSTLEVLSANPDWRALYDSAPTLHFAELGVQTGQAVAGCIRPSSDASGRRFPFVVADAFASEQPMAFMVRAPLALARVWVQTDQWANKLHASPDPSELLEQLQFAQQDVETSGAAYQAAFSDFQQLQTVGELQAMLAGQHPEADLLLIVIGLGLILRDVPASGADRLDRGLCLPLPAERTAKLNVASWWLQLITGFVARADFEVLLVLPQVGPSGDGAPVLHVGFAGRSAQGLAAMFDPGAREAAYVGLMAPDWADPAKQQDWGVKKLADALREPSSSLAQVSAVFREVFLGE